MNWAGTGRGAGRIASAQPRAQTKATRRTLMDQYRSPPTGRVKGRTPTSAFNALTACRATVTIRQTHRRGLKRVFCGGSMALEHQQTAAPPPEFKPYVPSAASVRELTPRALVMGMFFGLVFGAVTVYVGLRAGLTVSASIPIAVLSISLLRALGRATILENNIVQTTGSAGESVAAGVIFTLPALIFLGFDLEYTRIFLLALLGGCLGVLFMIPLRRQLIVKEHGNLLYPEGAACADVLVAGEKGGSFASRVFWGLGLGGLYTLLQNENAFAVLKSTPEYQPP